MQRISPARCFVLNLMVLLSFSLVATLRLSAAPRGWMRGPQAGAGLRPFAYAAAPPAHYAQVQPYAPPQRYAAPQQGYGAPQQQQHYGPVPQGYAGQHPNGQQGPGTQQGYGAQQHATAPQHSAAQHLPEWMARHSNLSLPEQQRALENEPGFRSLPPQTQMRLHNQLEQLNRMPPEQRRRLLQRNEAMERLSPQQRQQFDGALARLGALPPDRRRLVARAERDLREMPPAQRQVILNSDRMRGEFTDQERGTLSSLLAVEPYIPAQPPVAAPPPAIGH